jgi:hypothetical protein
MALLFIRAGTVWRMVSGQGFTDYQCKRRSCFYPLQKVSAPLPDQQNVEPLLNRQATRPQKTAVSYAALKSHLLAQIVFFGFCHNKMCDGQILRGYSKRSIKRYLILVLPPVDFP